MPKIDIAGLDIHYVERGSGDPMLIFPDNLHASNAYLDEIDYFSDRFHVLSFDYPGTGRSTREVRYQDEREYDLWNFRADLACHLLLDLDLAECYALGTGGGALAALHFAGKQSDLHGIRARGVIADSFLSSLDGRALHRWLDTREHYYVRKTESLTQEHGDDWRQVVDADTAFLRRLADHGGYAVPNFVLNGIRCPVLLTGTQRDPLFPGLAQAFAQISSIVPDCSIFLPSRSGNPYGEEHPLMWTNRNLFRRMADSFLRRWTKDERSSMTPTASA
jgi:pimeloyl-ACP methyl ester carboxylesterase